MKNTSTIQGLYPYQENAVNTILGELAKPEQSRVTMVYQLPTGGGKTVIFSRIAKDYIAKHKRKVLVLTHRIELSVQTAQVLREMGISTKVINNKVRDLEDQDDYDCFVAMVETLNNRLSEESFRPEKIGLLIIDEAHYNYFRKIFKYFQDSSFIGFTATPISSSIQYPLYKDYQKILVGESIPSLVKQSYLSKATTFSFDVDLKSLKVGINGDYTVSSSERLYSSEFMLNKLLSAYEQQCVGRKTLIFNSGIITSQNVYQMFIERGYTNVKHLDSTFSDKERKKILTWFKETPDAILTSVGILTTGFDEPSVEVILLNRATRSIALYFQMIGRGSRKTETKSLFTIIDLGNNAKRFGLWDEEIDWKKIFYNPTLFLEDKIYGDKEGAHAYQRPTEIQEKFPNKPEGKDFNISEFYKDCAYRGDKTIQAIDKSIENHLEWIRLNAEDFWVAMELKDLLRDEIRYRVHVYAQLINASENYSKWLLESYQQKLLTLLRQHLDQ